MKKIVYIHTNNKQRLGAKIAKHAPGTVVNLVETINNNNNNTDNNDNIDDTDNIDESKNIDYIDMNTNINKENMAQIIGNKCEYEYETQTKLAGLFVSNDVLTDVKNKERIWSVIPNSNMSPEQSAFAHWLYRSPETCKNTPEMCMPGLSNRVMLDTYRP